MSGEFTLLALTLADIVAANSRLHVVTDEESATMRAAVVAGLTEEGVAPQAAAELADRWVTGMRELAGACDAANRSAEKVLAILHDVSRGDLP